VIYAILERRKQHGQDKVARAAGSASALLGVLRIIIGVVAVPLVGLGGSETAVPMAVTIAAFGIATLATVVIVDRSGKIDAKAR
jgi:hypothetical protein